MIRIALNLLVPTLAISLLCGCMPELKSDSPPERIYWMETTEIEATPAVRLQVSVVQGLDSDHIWLLEQDQRLNFYAGAFWPDNLRPLLDSLMNRSLRAHRDGLEIDLLVERFFAVDRGADLPPEVTLRALVTQAELSCRFERSRNANTDRLRDVVAAHQALLDTLTGAVATLAQTGRCP